MVNLTDSDRQDINILIGLGQSMLDNYRKLIELEANFKKQSDEYKGTLECLKSTLALEENIYDRMNLNPEKIIAYFMEIGDPLTNMDFNNQLNIFLASKQQELINTRIVNNLYKKIISFSNSEGKSFMGGLRINKQTGETTTFNPENIIKLEEEIKKDTIFTIIKFLDAEINNENNCHIRPMLIEKKYFLTFMNPQIETKLIEQNYESGELYLSSKAYSTIYKVNQEFYKVCLFKFSKPLFYLGANKLANIHSEDLTTLNKKSETVILKTLLKSCLVLDGETYEDDLRKQTELQINVMFKPKTYGINMIIDTLEHINEDKQIPKVITLNLKKES